MKQFLLFSIMSILYNAMPAQSLEHVSVFGGTKQLSGTDVETDILNNIYTSGYFSEMVDFDPGAGTFNLASIGTVDVFVTKISAQGDFIWAKQIGGNGTVYSNKLSIDDLGNVYVSGFFENTIEFDPGANSFNITSNGSFDSFILKLDMDGNFVWAKRFGGSGQDRGQAIEVDASGNVYTTGIFNLTVDFDPGSGSFPLTSMGGDFDVYISKLDTDGNFIWVKQIGGNSNVLSNDLTVDGSGNVYSTGFYSNGSPDFDPGANTYPLEVGGTDKMYISKLDASGNFVWAKQILGNISHGNGIAVQADNLVVSGYFLGIQDFDPGPGTFEMGSFGLFDAFVLKLDTNGNFDWAKQMGGIGRDESLSVKIDANGSIISIGIFEATADFDVTGSTFNITSQGLHDAFVHNMDTSGLFLWVSQIGGTNQEYIEGLAIDTNNDVLSTGYFYETTDFDPSANSLDITSLGESDAFVLKLQGTTLEVSENFISIFRLYPNPTSGEFTIDLGKSYPEIKTTITNALGHLIASEIFVNTDTLDLNIEARTGIYFVNVTTQEGLSETIKIIKN